MGPDAWVVCIRSAPVEPDSREMLELVLAGASLDIELVVVFSGPGSEHLVGEAFGPWRQLVDFDLARLLVRPGGASTPPPGVREVTDADIDSLCRSVAGVLEL